MFRRNRVKPIVAGLSSDNAATREQAAKDLEALDKSGLDESEAFFALRSATKKFPSGKYSWQDTSSELVRAATRKRLQSLVPVIDESFDAYSPPAQASALEALATITTRDAAKALLSCLTRSASTVTIGELRGLSAAPHHADVFFPSLLQLLARPELRWSVLHATLSFLESGQLSDTTSRAQACSAIKQVHRTLHPVTASHQQSEAGPWVWAEEYEEHRSMSGLVLDVLGHLGSGCAETDLATALGYSDPKLVQFAVLGLVRMGHVPPAEALTRVASWPESRKWLLQGLSELRRGDLFPTAFLTQEALAESDMVNWLTFPTELARGPDQIELKAVVPADTPSGPGKYYVFRFRTLPPHWAAKDGWLAGVSGPFLDKASLTAQAPSDTFSTFTPWDSKSVEQHLHDIVGLMGRARGNDEGGEP